ncbi:MAG: NERD domain-containing protein [Rikenellaceae bacterium]|nr:NERD domain-containing protein [Rikenellaceae bacterium]
MVSLLLIILLVVLISRKRKRNAEQWAELEEQRRLARIAELQRLAELEEQRTQTLNAVTNANRGTDSEHELILSLLEYGIQAKAIFHDLYFRKPNGGYSQVDVVVATNVGIIVFEVKDYSGWIYGNGIDNMWTQVLAYGEEKHRFYNPVKQNFGHINTIKCQLKQFENIPFYSVIVFYGTSHFEKVYNIPHYVKLIYPSDIPNVLNHILQTNPPAPYTDKWEVVNLFKQAVANGTNGAIVNAHNERIQRRFVNKKTNKNEYRPYYAPFKRS